MLLPYAGLGWIVGLTLLAARRASWRHAALVALVVATVGAPNATATAMIVPAPVLWLVHAAWDGEITWRRAGVTAARIGGLCVAVSLWWLAMLSVQGRYGADVLAYSETLEAVSLTSTSTETLRGMGYWLFYVRDPVGFTTSAAEAYMASGRYIVTSFALTVLGPGRARAHPLPRPPVRRAARDRRHRARRRRPPDRRPVTADVTVRRLVTLVARPRPAQQHAGAPDGTCSVWRSAPARSSPPPPAGSRVTAGRSARCCHRAGGRQPARRLERRLRRSGAVARPGPARRLAGRRRRSRPTAGGLSGDAAARAPSSARSDGDTPSIRRFPG